MELVYRFFNNSEANDRLYNANDLNEYLSNLVSEGVILNTPDSLKVVRNTGLLLEAMPGYAVFNKCFVQNTSEISFPIEKNTTRIIRRDRCILRYSAVDRNVDYIVLKGNANGTAQSIQRSRYVYDIVLAEILVRPNVTTIADADILDTRSNSTLCGIVETTFSQISNDELIARIEAAFTELMTDVSTTSKDDNAIRLALQVTDLENNKFPSNTYANNVADGIINNQTFTQWDNTQKRVNENLIQYIPGQPKEEVNIALSNGITAVNYSPVAVKIGKFVTVMGSVKGVSVKGEVIANAPEGFRPTRPQYFVGNITVTGSPTMTDFVRYRLAANGDLIMDTTLSGGLGNSNATYDFKFTFINDPEVTAVG